MALSRLGGGRHPQAPRGGLRTHDIDRHDFGLTTRERARLVEDDGVHFGEALEELSALEKHSLLSGEGHRREGCAGMAISGQSRNP